jgi:hypothetical protein
LSDPNKGEQNWALVGKISTVVAALTGVIALGLTLYDRASSKPNLEVKVSAVEYRSPPTIGQDSDFDSRQGQTPIIGWRPVPASSPWLSSYRGILRFDIANVGGAQAQGVKIMLPFGGVAEMIPDSETSQVSSFARMIAVGAIPPGQKTTVYAWTDSAPPFYGLDDLRITHTTGVADIVLLKETDGFWRTLGRAVLGILGLLGIVIAFFTGVNLLAAIATRLFGRKPPAKVTVNEADTEKQDTKP